MSDKMYLYLLGKGCKNRHLEALYTIAMYIKTSQQKKKHFKKRHTGNQKQTKKTKANKKQKQK